MRAQRSARSATHPGRPARDHWCRRWRAAKLIVVVQKCQAGRAPGHPGHHRTRRADPRPTTLGEPLGRQKDRPRAAPAVQAPRPAGSTGDVMPVAWQQPRRIWDWEGARQLLPTCARNPGVVLAVMRAPKGGCRGQGICVCCRQIRRYRAGAPHPAAAETASVAALAWIGFAVRNWHERPAESCCCNCSATRDRLRAAVSAGSRGHCPVRFGRAAHPASAASSSWPTAPSCTAALHLFGACARPPGTRSRLERADQVAPAATTTPTG